MAALLTMRVKDLILRSIVKRYVSKDEAPGVEFRVLPRRQLRYPVNYLSDPP